MKVEKIKKIKARQILESRGNPTVEVDVLLENGILNEYDNSVFIFMSVP